MTENDESLRRITDAALSGVNAPEAAKNALGFLFPKLNNVLKTYISSRSSDDWDRRRRRRISISDFAPAYFRMDPQRATWPRSEMDTIINQEHPSSAIQMIEERLTRFGELDKPRLRKLFLDELRALFHHQPMTLEWLQAIIEISPIYIIIRDEVRGFLSVDNSDRLRGIVIDGLRSLTSSECANLVSNVIPDAHDITLLCDLVRTIAGDVRLDGSATEFLHVSFGDDVGNIRMELLNKTRKFAESGRLWQQADIRTVLWFWWGATTDYEVQNFTKQALDTTVGANNLLQITVSRVYSTTGTYERVTPQWTAIVDIDQLAKIANRRLEEPNTPDADRESAHRYLAAYKRKGDFP